MCPFYCGTLLRTRSVGVSPRGTLDFPSVCQKSLNDYSKQDTLNAHDSRGCVSQVRPSDHCGISAPVDWRQHDLTSYILSAATHTVESRRYWVP